MHLFSLNFLQVRHIINMPPKRKSRPDPASIDLVSSKKQKKPSKTIITSIQIEDDGKTRCFGNDSKIYREYHDTEWGVPILNDDNKLFELLCLEGIQHHNAILL